MALTFNYQCGGCGDFKSNHDLQSFACRCGGNFALSDGQLMEAPVFDAYFDPTIEKHVTSYREQEKLGKSFRSKAHPHGLTIRQDTKFHRETEYIKKHKEDYLQMQWSKTGHKYKPGSKARMNDATGQLSSPTQRRTVYFT